MNIICKEEMYDIPKYIELSNWIFKSIRGDVGTVKDGWLITGNDKEENHKAVLASMVLTFITTRYMEYKDFKLLNSYSFGNTKYYKYIKK